LERGHKVLALDSLRFGGAPLLPYVRSRNFTFVKGDVRDSSVVRDALRETDVVIPLAAVVGAPACDREPDMARSTNLEAIRQLNTLRDPEQLVVYPTTNSGYGTQSGDQVCTETTPLEPISLYGITKVGAEELLLDSPNTITLRLATVFGPSPRMRIDLLVNHFTYVAVTDGYIVIFEKDFKRNYIHIEDVADCFVHCIDSGEAMIGRPFNVGLDEANYSKEELAHKVKDQVPDFYIHFASIGSDPDRRNYVVSNARLAAAGFRAARSVEQGIGELIAAYRLLERPTLSNA
jgi:nucleoside-diphosphate-sugar epimerase